MYIAGGDGGGGVDNDTLFNLLLKKSAGRDPFMQ